MPQHCNSSMWRLSFLYFYLGCGLGRWGCSYVPISKTAILQSTCNTQFSVSTTTHHKKQLFLWQTLPNMLSCLRVGFERTFGRIRCGELQMTPRIREYPFDRGPDFWMAPLWERFFQGHDGVVLNLMCNSSHLPLMNQNQKVLDIFHEQRRIPSKPMHSLTFLTYVLFSSQNHAFQSLTSPRFYTLPNELNQKIMWGPMS
ncbi:hypothetical protein NC651_019043 [Populus alba x Populus x berolinensis]|nr:hypothetical protein NC651_019043 [Populus alba x Populus x berolinensis]